MSGRSTWIGATSALVFLIGYGIALHDFAHQVYQLKGYHNLIEGGYIGFAMMAPIALGVLVVFIRNADQIRRAYGARTEDTSTVKHICECDHPYPSKEHEGTC